jgi:hypothetical protein
LRSRLALLSAISLGFAGCGYIGGVQPPLANIPGDPAELAALQRGATIYVHFKLPTMTTEMRPVKGDLELDLRAGITPDPWNLAQWVDGAHKFLPQEVKDGVAEYQVPSLAWTGKEITIAARVIGTNGKASNWSRGAALPVVAPLAAPTDLTAESTAKGVRLAWRAPERHFRVLRRSQGSADFAELGTSTTPEFLDAAAEFGKEYEYLVQAFEDLGDHREAQSDLTAERSITPKDVFPPAAPAGLRATAAANSIELSWDANLEPDLASYRVYRSVNGGAFEKIAEVSDIPTYSDKAVEAGKTYRYVVTAVDKSGNPSERSAVAEATL